VLIVPISRVYWPPTFGTAGPLAYAGEVNGVPYTNFQGDSNGGTRLFTPENDSTRIELYDFTGHLVGHLPAVGRSRLLERRSADRGSSVAADPPTRSSGGILRRPFSLAGPAGVATLARGPGSRLVAVTPDVPDCVLALLLPAPGLGICMRRFTSRAATIAPFAAVPVAGPVLTAR